MLSGEATYTNFIVFGLTRPGPEPSFYCTRGEHATGVVQIYWYIKLIVIFIYMYKHIAVFILFCTVWQKPSSIRIILGGWAKPRKTSNLNRHLLFGIDICWIFWKINPRTCIKIFEHIFDSVSVRAHIQYVHKYY